MAKDESRSPSTQLKRPKGQRLKVVIEPCDEPEVIDV
jgi:hypothetical protein